MSRLSDLYWQAAAKTTPPFRQLYFDTEPLRYSNWPAISAQLAYCLRIASHMGVEVYIPEPALYERSEQWIRDALAKMEAAQSKAKEARKYVGVLGGSVLLEVTSEANLRTNYSNAERELMAHFTIRPVPYPSRPLEEVFRMAVQRAFTFEESKDGVVGLQDCVILLSVFDHLSANPASAVLVSYDDVFSKIPSLCPDGVHVRQVRGLPELEKILDETLRATFSAEIRQWWTNTADEIKQVLLARSAIIGHYIEENIGSSELAKLFAGRVLTVEPPTVESIGPIRPEPEGASKDPLRFSCDVAFRVPQPSSNNSRRLPQS